MIQTFHTYVSFKKQLTKDVYVFTFALQDPVELAFQPGQYMVLFVPQNGDYARRLYSIATPSTQKTSFDLIAKIIPGGVASEYFLKLKEKDAVLFQGPAGRFILKESNRNKVFLATGTGIAPMLSMLRTRLPYDHTNPTSYHLLWGLPKFEDMYFLEDLKTLSQKYHNFSFTISLSRETDLSMIPEADRIYFKLGRVTQDFAADLNNTDYYLCGNRDVVESLKIYLTQQKVDNTCVIFEKF